MAHDVSHTPQPRIVWCDNEQQPYNHFLVQWKAADTGYDLVFQSFQALNETDSSEGEQARQALYDFRPSLFLLDWEEGASRTLWDLLNNKNIPLALMSVSPLHVIQAHKHNLSKFSGLTEHRVLNRPFGVESLLALLPKVDKPQPVPQKNAIRNFVASLSKAKPKQPPSQHLDIPEAYGAWRWLNEEFRYLQHENKVSAGWKLNFNRPEIKQLTDDEKKRLHDTSPWEVRQYLWHELPHAPGQFDRVMLETRRLQASDPAPSGAVYVQQAVRAPVMKVESLERRMIHGVIELMQGIEFARGRYYHHSHVPGLQKPVLELLVVEPQLPQLLPPPAVAEMDSEEDELIESLVRAYKEIAPPTHKSELIYRKILLNLGPESQNDQHVWKRYVSTDGIDEVLVVPVYFTNSEIDKRVNGGYQGSTRYLRGVFIFDLGGNGNIGTRRIEIAKPALLSALGNYKTQRENARLEYERLRLGELNKLHVALGQSGRLQDVAQLACQTALHLMALDEQSAEKIENTAQANADRSVLYVRYSATRKMLEHVATASSHSDNSPPLNPGDCYPLDCSRFFLVEAAQAALSYLRIPLKNHALQPLLRPDAQGLPPNRKLTIEDWYQVFGNDPNRIDQAQTWYEEKVRSVLAYPVVAQGALHGVLVVRSDRVYEFTQRRVKAVAEVVQAMQAHLVRVGLLQQWRAWHGLLAHELRSVLGRLERALASSGAGATAQATPVQALLLLATTLAQGSLYAIHGDERPMQPIDAMTSVQLWTRVDAIAQIMCAQAQSANDSGAITWSFTRLDTPLLGEDESVNAPDLLFRVLLILVDNAFRHGDFNSAHASNAVCLQVNKEGNDWQLCFRNPGQWSSALLEHWETAIQNLQWLEEQPDQQQSYFGLSLTHWLCTQAGASVHLENECNNISASHFTWPSYAQSARLEGESP